MPGNNKDDLRVKKTYKSLYDALSFSLETRNFNDITVNNLCTQALVSRATFYAHFKDKYDLFSYSLAVVKEQIVKDVSQYEELERDVSTFIFSHKRVITNVITDANNETLRYLNEFISSIVRMFVKRIVIIETNPHQIILINFLTGGLMHLLRWMVEHHFPPEVHVVNDYFYNMLESITAWDAQQEKMQNKPNRDKI